MIARILGVIIVCGTMLVGCVTKGTHEATLTDLDKAQKALTKTAAEFDAYKEQATGQIAGLEADKTKLSSDLLSAQNVSTQYPTGSVIGRKQRRMIWNRDCRPRRLRSLGYSKAGKRSPLRRSDWRRSGLPRKLRLSG